MPSLPHLPREVIVATGVVGVLFLLWLWVHFSRRHLVVIKKSDTTELLAIELGRIADSLERLAAVAARGAQVTPRQTEAPVAEEKPARHLDWMSIFPR